MFLADASKAVLAILRVRTGGQHVGALANDHRDILWEHGGSLCSRRCATHPIRQFDIPTIERLGREMYEQDQEAWKATDILFAKHSRAELRAEKQQLWVVDKLPDRDIVRFVDNRDTGPVPAYDVTFVAGKDPVLSSSVEATLTLDELAQYDARLLAGKNVTRPCAPTYNTIALKDPAGDKWLVWAMAATTDPNALVIGGHYRFTISKDGMSLIESDTLSRGCLTIERPKLDNDCDSRGGIRNKRCFLSPARNPCVRKLDLSRCSSCRYAGRKNLEDRSRRTVSGSARFSWRGWICRAQLCRTKRNVHAYL
ncbi:MAG: hypothetical protein WDM89_03285 [Rhizomicrobium sp.]